MKWIENPKSLSIKDMDRLAGSPIMMDFLSNRLIIKFYENEKVLSYQEMGFHESKYFYHTYRQNGTGVTVISAMFMDEEDKNHVMRTLALVKLQQDNSNDK